MELETAILTAIIAAIVAILGQLLGLLRFRQTLLQERAKFDLARQDLELKTRSAEDRIRQADAQLALKREELEGVRLQIHQKMEEIRQAQFAEVIRARLDAYPEIYATLQRFNRIWRTQERPLDHDWAKGFLDALLDLNARHGVLFSQDVYTSYSGLRWHVEGIERKLREGGLASAEDIEEIDAHISGPLKEGGASRASGLGSHMKDDLGSYRTAAISARGG